MQEHEDKQLLHDPLEDDLYDMNTVASATECTGLIPTPPGNDSEAEAYTDIYNIPQPQGAKDNRERMRSEKFQIGTGTARSSAENKQPSGERSSAQD